MPQVRSTAESKVESGHCASRIGITITAAEANKRTLATPSKLILGRDAIRKNRTEQNASDNHQECCLRTCCDRSHNAADTADLDPDILRRLARASQK